MTHKSKRTREIAKSVDPLKIYGLREAIELLQRCPSVKFDQTVGLSIVLGIDAKKSDQQVRGTVSLPSGTGRKNVVVVLAKGEKVKEALEAGADFAGFEELFDKIRDGWTSFDAVIATPDMMREVGKLGKILGPRNLMPTPRAGTVTTEVAKAVREVKAGKIEFKADKHGQVNVGTGKLSFSVDAIEANVQSLIGAIGRSKPSSSKGQFVRQVVLTSTMGPGLKLNLRELAVV
ncbi:MAG: 50S ribosomal protein L1 [Chlamydiia bacterium]